MKLSELAEATATSIPTLKFWMREGLLPAGELRNQTTAVYGSQHVERVALIQTLRAEFDAPIARIRELTSVIDDPESRMLDVMRHCHVFANRLARQEAPEAHREQVAELQERLGWPHMQNEAVDTLASALAWADRVGYPFAIDDLTKYAVGLEPIAEDDIQVIRPQGSFDAVAHNLLLGTAAQRRVLLAMNQVVHAIVATRAMAGLPAVGGAGSD